MVEIAKTIEIAGGYILVYKCEVKAICTKIVKGKEVSLPMR